MEENNQQNNHSERGQLSYFKGVVFILVLLIIGILVWLPYRSGDAVQTIIEREGYSAEVIVMENPFDTISLEAQAAHVWDINSKETLYDLNAESQLPLASLTKLMTVLVAAEILEPSQTIVV